MEEVFKEIIPLVAVKKDKGKKMLSIFSKEYAQSFGGEPLCFINKIPILSSEKVLNLNPDDVNEIQVIYKEKKLRKLGVFGVNGIVSISTKLNNKNSAAQNISDNSLIVFDGFYFEQESIKTVRIKYNLSKVPDLRRVLYWNTDLPKNNLGKISFTFKTSDVPDDYIVKVEGITDAGVPISKTISFKVLDTLVK